MIPSEARGTVFDVWTLTYRAQVVAQFRAAQPDNKLIPFVLAGAGWFQIVDNGGHAWPGKPQPAFEQTFGHGTTDIDATNLMFSFFFDHKT